MPEAPGTTLITGGTRGLGRALSLRAARAGMEVLALYRSDEEAARALLREAAGLPGTVRCVRHDVTQPGFPEPPEGGRLVFIHAAAVPFRPAPLHLLKDEDFHDQWRVAVLGFLNGLRVVLRPMVRSGGGTVVAVLTSALAGAPPRGFGAYAAAKAALQEITGSVGTEYGPRGVRALCVSPGFMATDFSASWDERIRAAVCGSQVGGALAPDAVAEGIWRLVDPPD